MSGKADLLGASSAFGRAGSARSARGRVAEKVLGGNDDGPTRLALHLLSFNPDNPRDSLPDVTELAASLRDHGQKSAVTIMSRDAYLSANPGREDELEPRAAYVVIDGNCRLAAARQGGLSSLRVMMDESLGGDPDELLESALVANIHRQDLDPLDEARALKKLLVVHGTQDKLAKRLHRSQGWVSQRLALLSLTPELQKRLEAGEEPVDLLRAVGKKPPERQERELARLKEERARKHAIKETAKKQKPLPAEEEAHYGVIEEAAAEAEVGTAMPSQRLTEGDTAAEGPNPTMGRGSSSETVASSTSLAPDPIADAMRVLLEAKQTDAGAIADALGTTLDREVLEAMVEILQRSYLEVVAPS